MKIKNAHHQKSSVMTPELHAPYRGKLRNGYLKEKFLDSPKKIVIGSKSELGHRE